VFQAALPNVNSENLIPALGEDFINFDKPY